MVDLACFLSSLLSQPVFPCALIFYSILYINYCLLRILANLRYSKACLRTPNTSVGVDCLETFLGARSCACPWGSPGSGRQQLTISCGRGRIWEPSCDLTAPCHAGDQDQLILLTSRLQVSKTFTVKMPGPGPQRLAHKLLLSSEGNKVKRYTQD